MPQFSDDLFLGSAQSFVGTDNNNALGDPSPMDLGFGPMGRVYLYDIVPVANTVVLPSTTSTGATTYSGTQLAAASAANGTSYVTLADGTQVLQLDCPRAVSTNGAASVTSGYMTVTGYDYYGQAMSEIINYVASTQTNGRKAFFQISSVTFSAASTANVSVNTLKIFGLPAKVTDPAYVFTAKFSAGTIDNTSGVVAGLGGGTTTYSKQAVSALTIAAPGVFTVAYSPPSGTLIQLTGTLGSLGGVSLNTTYWWTNASATTGTISTTQANYLAGTKVTTTGSYTANALSIVPQAVSTPTTPDVRGTYVLSGAPDGTKRLVINMGLTAIQVGPNSTRTGLLGVDQA
jgi:hypothetical protein